MYWVPTLQQNLTSALLLLIVTPMGENNLLHLLFFAIIQVFLLTYGFVINDIGDKESDIAAGKLKDIQKYSKKKSSLIISLLTVGFLFIPIFFGGVLIMVLSVFIFFLATFYSLKPLRFKERGILGILVADISSRSALFLIFGLFISAQPLNILFFMGWLFVIGFQDELNHQLVDISADKKSGAKTWVQVVGQKRGEQFLIAALMLSFLYLIIPFLLFTFLFACIVTFVLFIFRVLTLQYIYYRFFFQKQKSDSLEH
jgi:4-hydroxybenzoate polyprenyltransferase